MADFGLNGFVFYALLGVIGLVALIALLFCLLWRQKRREDRCAYCNILHEPRVKTVYSPEEYTNNCKK